MAPARTGTGDTGFFDEKRAQTPASPTNTDTTLRGDAFIEIGEIHAQNASDEVRPPSFAEAVQPGR